VATLAISPDNNQLIDKLAKAAFERFHREAVARLREDVQYDEPRYHLAWEQLDDSCRVPWRYGVHEALVAWLTSGTMHGCLTFPDDF
jgi:hypothetical protein